MLGMVGRMGLKIKCPLRTSTNLKGCGQEIARRMSDVGDGRADGPEN
jgi:hypothetical protein